MRRAYFLLSALVTTSTSGRTHDVLGLRRRGMNNGLRRRKLQWFLPSPVFQALVKFGNFPFSVQNLPCDRCLYSADPVPRGDMTAAGQSGALLRGGCRTDSAFHGCMPSGIELGWTKLKSESFS